MGDDVGQGGPTRDDEKRREAVRNRAVTAWRAAARARATSRLAERELTLALVEVDREGVDLRDVSVWFPIEIRSKVAEHERWQVDPAPRHHDSRGRDLNEVIDGYAAGQIDREEALDLLAGWPYQPPASNELNNPLDMFTAVLAAVDGGLMTKEDLADIRSRRALTGRVDWDETRPPRDSTSGPATDSPLHRVEPWEWSLSDSVDYEVALEIIGEMVAMTSAELAEAERDTSPQSNARVEELLGLQRAYAEERRLLRSHDRQSIIRVRDFYGAELRRRRGLAP